MTGVIDTFGHASLVFVYGSLLSGLHNHGVLGPSRLVGNAAMFGGNLYSLGHFPGLILPDVLSNTDWVIGEVYEIPDQLVAHHLDTLEGHPSHYKRELRTVEVVNDGLSKSVQAWVYVYQYSVNNYAKVPDGDWRAYLAGMSERRLVGKRIAL